MYITIFFVRVFVFLIFCCLNKYFSSEDDDSSCCCECCECCLEDKKSEGELFKKVVIEEGYKYEGNTKKNVTNSQYGILTLPNVPFFCSYNTVSDVIILFAFELYNKYFAIFPEAMKKIVNTCIKEAKMQKNDVKIFFCYQYLITKIVAKTFADSLGDAINEEILFRPHFFIGKEEIDQDSGAKQSDCISIYANSTLGNKCVVFNKENKEILNQLEKNFSIHGGAVIL